MNILHLSNGDIQGGAARAAYRIHTALLAAGHQSGMFVRNQASDDWRVKTPSGTGARMFNRLRSPAGKSISALQRNPGPGGPRNGAWLSTRIAPMINAGATEVVNLHWIASETISMRDLCRIDRPLIWTLHDMWPFCGMEHYAPQDSKARWRVGYTKANRPKGAGGLDLDRVLWRQKAKLAQRQLTLISPSRWLADCVRQSAVFADTPMEIIGHPLDLSVFRPLEKGVCRDILGLPQDHRIILFGAVGGGADPRKGYDLLRAALWKSLRCDSPNPKVSCVIFGQSAPQSPTPLPVATRWMGRLHDDTTLAMLYSAADIMVVPSRQEAFGQTASEAAACGCPSLAFDDTGVADIITHKKTGYLAKPFEIDDLANGISWMMSDQDRLRDMGLAARKRAVDRWSEHKIAQRYGEVYQAAIEDFTASRKGLRRQ